jgi:hypothetical protein
MRKQRTHGRMGLLSGMLIVIALSVAFPLDHYDPSSRPIVSA